MNIQIENTRKNLVNDINNSGLPVGVALYILKDIVHELENAYNTIIQREYQNQIEDDIEDENDIEEEDGVSEWISE